MLTPHPCRQSDTANQHSIKRWFSDPTHDLFVWLNAHGQITAFQFSYDKTGNEHLLSWSEAHGYSHDRIDDGETTPFQTMTPIMVPNGIVDCVQVAETFRSVSKLLEPELVAFIYRRLIEYGS
ncbi:MAG: hypothetical protein QG652_613 [Pseudomonadota bacterium]|nr:hypothetical protein [Pseudomonadota bacterium]